MTSILSSVSGHFSKALILGTFFPTAFFVVLGWLFLVPLFPAEWVPLTALSALDPQWQLAAVTLIVFILSGVLYNLNIPIIRFYEGYPWMNTTFGKNRRDHYSREVAASSVRRRRLLVLGSAFGDNPVVKEVIEDVNREWKMEGEKLNTNWPTRYGVLPTRVGNVIRSFEEYPYTQYKIEAITMWPRLMAEIDEKYAPAIDDAKIPFDFMLNSSMLSASLSIAILAVGLIFPTRLATFDLWPAYVPWLLEIIAFAVLAVFFYRSAIGRATAWGGMVKSAFDLYKSDLLTKLGYKQDTSTRKNERKLWDRISLQMLYGDHPTLGPRTDYASPPPPPEDPPTFASAGGDRADLQVTRGVSLTPAGQATTIVLLVRNTTQERHLPKVIVTDTVTAGFDYEWGSATAGNQPLPVAGVNPYHFLLGDLGPGAEAQITYRIVPRYPYRIQPEDPQLTLPNVLRRLFPPS